MFRRDRRNRFRGGGLLVYVKSDLCPHLRPDLTNPDIECTALEFRGGEYRRGTEGFKGGILCLIRSSCSGSDCAFVLLWLLRFAAGARLTHAESLLKYLG